MHYQIALLQISLSTDLTGMFKNRDKVGRNYYNYFNVCGEDGLMHKLDLEHVKYQKINEAEEIFMVIIPRDAQKNEECNEAKRVELKKLKDFKSYEEIRDS